MTSFRIMSSPTSPELVIDLRPASGARPGPVGGVRDANRRLQATRIARAGLDLFLERGIESVSIEEIVLRAGVAKGSFYRYFDDRVALVEALVGPLARAIEEAADECRASLILAATPEQATGAYVQMAVRLAPVITGSQDVVQLYLQESRGPAHGARQPLRTLYERIEAIGVGLSATATEQGLVGGAPPEVAGRVVIGAIEQLAHAHIRGCLGVDPAFAGLAVVRMVIEGVRPRS